MAELGLPLRPGSDGEAVRDVQRQLTSAGFDAGDEVGYGPGTVAAVRAFQAARRISVDGIVGPETWAALCDARYRLGDRLLYLRTPMLRGDDVADLQRQLGSLGFDAGRVDGVFGPETERALKDFQRNSALSTDAVCGPDVLAALARLGGTTAAANVAEARELEALRRRATGLRDRRVAVGDAGGLGVLTVAIARALRDRGAHVSVTDHPDASTRAQAANAFGAEVYLGLRISDDGLTDATYYAAPGFSSPGGRQLAELVCEELTLLLGDAPPCVGMRSTVLHETRMPAVVCRFGTPGLVVRQTAELADRMAAAVARWTTTPVPN